MALTGQYTWFNSLHQGGKKAISFILTCDNWMSSEVFDCAIIDSKGTIPPQIRRQLKLSARKSFTFNFDTCGWDWCNGDFFAILGKNDKIKKRWDLNIREYKRGECPDCHGTHKCIECNGTGMIIDHQYHTVTKCRTCGGTGVCQRCYVPKRGYDLSSETMPNPEITRQGKIDVIHRQITDLESKLSQLEWEIKMMDLKGQELSLNIVYRTKLEMKFRYERELLELQNELTQIETL